MNDFQRNDSDRQSENTIGTHRKRSHRGVRTRKTFGTLLATLALGAAVHAQSPITLYDNLSNLTVNQSPTYGGFINSTATANNLSSNAFYGQKSMGYSQTFGSNTITNLYADDTTFFKAPILATDPNPGFDSLRRVLITQVSLVVTNTQTSAATARLHLRFYNDSGTSVDPSAQPGFPGTYLNPVDYTTTVSLAAASSNSTFSSQLVTINLATPLSISAAALSGATKRLWVGAVFDDANGTLSPGNLADIGLLYNNPTGLGFADDHPIVGTSGDVAAGSGDADFNQTATANGFASNSPGTYAFNTEFDPDPNISNLRTDLAIRYQGFGLFVAAPEPGSLLFLGTGLLSTVVIRRRRKA